MRNEAIIFGVVLGLCLILSFVIVTMVAYLSPSEEVEQEVPQCNCNCEPDNYTEKVDLYYDSENPNDIYTRNESGGFELNELE